MDAESLLELYRQIGKQNYALPEMETASVSIQTDPFKSNEDAWKRLEEFKPSQGWIGFKSANRLFTQGILPAMDDETGSLLSAEAVNAQGKSLHVRYDGAGQWLVTQYGLAAGTEYLADTLVHIAHDNALGQLRYRRFWRIGDDGGAEPFAACFIGFGKNKE
ncbi:MAG: hypothetical protein A2286_03435 [Gammaproteobacteria bacterium RIFOXYA12_FULL_61_12]|nr:MAG: hypothetical protein A2286_03435 [Gammaproteobacteria bacterium RIFOXYA12_FULL_61_12]OGT91286.1 MAG: hypothetical protein A2514_10990 [Gammaproteobacteria bacterium RIFOXYD12_FULL_61_37]